MKFNKGLGEIASTPVFVEKKINHLAKMEMLFQESLRRAGAHLYQSCINKLC